MTPLAFRPDLDAALQRARLTTNVDEAGSFASPPPRARELRATVELVGSFDLARAALHRWDVHRGAGLRVVADGDVRPGATVVSAVRLGPMWAVAPCRVTDVVDGPDAAGFTYATLPGHPERGVERFILTRTRDGARFEVVALSAPAAWPSRLAPPVGRRVQRAITARYLRSAAAAARPAAPG